MSVLYNVGNYYTRRLRSPVLLSRKMRVHLYLMDNESKDHLI